MNDFDNTLLPEIKSDTLVQSRPQVEVQSQQSTQPPAPLAVNFSLSSPTGSKGQRNAKDFLEDCKLDPAIFNYYSKLFEYLSGKQNLRVVYGEKGFSINSTVKCYPPGTRKNIEIDTVRCSEGLKKLLTKWNADTSKKLLTLSPTMLPIEKMLEVLDAF